MPDVFVAPEEEPESPPSKKTAKKSIAKKQEKAVVKEPEPVEPGTIAVPKKSMTLFTHFCPYPQDISFENQEKGEVIQLFLRRHFVTNTSWILASLLFVLLPLAALLFFSLAHISISVVPQRYLIILTLFYYVVVVGYTTINYVIWFYNVGLVTNLRIVDVDVSHISQKNVASTGIAELVDVEYNQNGFLSNFFHFGNVHIQTEGVKPNFEFIDVPNPAKVADTITDLIRKENHNE